MSNKEEAKDLFEYNPENIQKQLGWIDTLSRTITEIGKTFSKKKSADIGGIRTFVLLDILSRINFNLEGLVQLYKQFIVQQDMRVPINLLYRGCLADVLTGLYFLDFLSDEKSFINEIEVMNLDYAKYSKFVIENEPKLIKTMPDEEIESYINKMKIDYISENSLLFNSLLDWKLKSPSALRINSQNKFFKNKADRNISIKESTKYDTILNNNEIKHLAPAYLLFRYFSQYQHYTFNGRGTLGIEPEVDIKYYYISIMLICETAYIMLKVIGVSDKFLLSLKSISEELVQMECKSQ